MNRETARAWQTWIALRCDTLGEVEVQMELDAELDADLDYLADLWGMSSQDVLAIFVHLGALAEGAYP